jgi:ABC-type transport system involved in multi-copper enzyme maturation permease subunit
MLIAAAALAVILWLSVAADPGSGPKVAEFSSGLVKVATVILGGLLGLGTMLHAVNAVTREREKDTLDGLLVLPVTRGDVLSAKWFGGLVSLRLLVAALGVVWLFGMMTGGLHPLALVALVLSVAAVMEFLASLGLFLSVFSKTSLRANMAAVLCVLLIVAGPFVVSQYMELLAPYPYSAIHQGDSEAVWQALMPAAAWVQLCVGWHEYGKLAEGHFPAILCGALGYAVAAWLLWRLTLSRFRRYGGKRT